MFPSFFSNKNPTESPFSHYKSSIFTTNPPFLLGFPWPPRFGRRMVQGKAQETGHPAGAVAHVQGMGVAGPGVPDDVKIGWELMLVTTNPQYWLLMLILRLTIRNINNQ